MSRVVPVGVGYNDDPLPAGNIFDMGWLTDSALPGGDGVMVLSGYTAGPTKPGPLASIGNLKVGDDIILEQGDGKNHTYKVVRSQQYAADKVDMNEVRSPAIAGRAGLNIITYTGRFNVRANQFEPRTAIFATLQ
jgi:sortase (surface protein transpeptidase)